MNADGNLACIDGISYVKVFPRIPQRPPRLLSHLQSALVDAKRMGDRLTTIGKISSQDPRKSQNLSLEAHKRVLQQFIDAFETYREFLKGIKVGDMFLFGLAMIHHIRSENHRRSYIPQEHMDKSLNDGLCCANENIALRKELAKMEESAQIEVKPDCLCSCY